MIKEPIETQLKRLYVKISELEYQVPKMTKMDIEQEVRKIKKELEKIIEDK